MAIYYRNMDISVTKFKHDCLRVIRNIEKTGRPIAITRRGRVVAQLLPSAGARDGAGLRPWQRLRALGGRLRARPGESVLRERDFEASR